MDQNDESIAQKKDASTNSSTLQGDWNDVVQSLCNQYTIRVDSAQPEHRNGTAIFPYYENHVIYDYKQNYFSPLLIILI